jgi:hypothetical protein
VDWLDYLEGLGEPELAEHLAGCQSCQTLVASLRAEGPAQVSTDWSKDFKGRVDAVWSEDRPTKPTPAEFWFSASDFDLTQVAVETKACSHAPSFAYDGLDRVLVLVLSHSDNEPAEWLDVVPVLSDIEAATETDLLFSEQENSLGTPWRAMFAHQFKMARRQLDARVGELSDVGTRVLLAALAGDVDDARWGVPIQHPDDPRSRLEHRFEETLRRLRTPWLLVHAADVDDDHQVTHDAQLHDVVPRPTPPGDRSKSCNVYWLAPVREQQHEFALAAASAPSAKRNLWVLDRDAMRLVGKLAVDWDKGILVFVVRNVHILRDTRLRLHVVAAGREYSSEPFAPKQNARVPLARNITTAQVEKLGAEVVT